MYSFKASVSNAYSSLESANYRCGVGTRTTLRKGHWFPRLRSNIVYGFAQVQDTAAEPVSVFHQSNYTAGNLIWNHFGSLTVGTEFLYGWRVNKDGTSGNAPRIMFSAKYNSVKTQVTE